MGKKRYEDLTFTDDFMFCKILSANPSLCKELLSLILNVNIKKIEFVQSQKTIEETYDGRGIRLDVYLDLFKKYYQGMIDLNLIERGARFAELKKSYIIFICCDDPFGKNFPMYSFSNRCKQDTTLQLGDDAHKIIINASGNREGLSQDMIAFLDYVSKKETNSKLTKELQNAVEEAISKKRWEVDYMTMLMKLNEEREEGRIEGREEGRIEENIRLQRKFKIPDNQIVIGLIEEFHLTKEEATKKINEYTNEEKDL